MGAGGSKKGKNREPVNTTSGGIYETIPKAKLLRQITKRHRVNDLRLVLICGSLENCDPDRSLLLPQDDSGVEGTYGAALDKLSE